MCFVGNKADNEIQRQVSFAEACNWCKSEGNIEYYETSAKENVGIDEIFEDLPKKYLREEEYNMKFMPFIDLGIKVQKSHAPKYLIS